jgi:hypothetical protein
VLHLYFPLGRGIKSRSVEPLAAWRRISSEVCGATERSPHKDTKRNPQDGQLSAFSSLENDVDIRPFVVSPDANDEVAAGITIGAPEHRC